MNNSYKVVFEASRPASSLKLDNVPLKRKWALVRVGKHYGYTVISRFASKEAAEAALAKIASA